MNLTGLHLLLTYRCTSECDHCFVQSSPRSEATMTLAMALDAVMQARKTGTVTEIWLEGGEPFLHYPILLEVVRYAASLKMETGIVTNAYFATTIDDAEVWLKPLKAAGLCFLSASDDSFHNDSAFSETPASRAVEACRRLNISVDTICIQPPQGIPNDKVKGEPILGGDVRFRGRAVDKLLKDDLPRRPWESFNECPDEDFEKIGRLHLDPHGYLYPCQGVVVGNLRKMSLAEVIRTYDPSALPVIGPLLRGGPAELVREHNLPLRGEYVDACHLCYLARQMLREKFPEDLAPPEVYGALS
jgi:MoaA/NifB/PqqE/SkfB family radical SAM enzyme